MRKTKTKKNVFYVFFFFLFYFVASVVPSGISSLMPSQVNIYVYLF